MARRRSRFDPLRQQSTTAGALRYGREESALAGMMRDAQDLLGTTTRAQQSSASGIVAGLRDAGPRLDAAFTSSGLTPAVRAQAGTDPAARRIAETLANAQVELQQREGQARQGAAFSISKALDDYGKTVTKLGQAHTDLARERGLFESSQFDQLVGADRSARHDTNEKARARTFDAAQSDLDRANSRGNALIGAGINPDTGAPLPESPKSRKPTAADRDAIATMDKASTWVGRLDNAGLKKKYPDAKARRRAVGEVLMTGDRESSVPAIPSYLLSAALDMHFDGHLSPATVKKLHAAGIRVRALPGSKTRQDTQAPGGPAQDAATTIAKILGGLLG